MTDTASPDSVVVYLYDYRRIEPKAASVDDAFVLWLASFRMMWLASFEVAEACQRQALRGVGGTVR